MAVCGDHDDKLADLGAPAGLSCKFLIGTMHNMCKNETARAVCCQSCRLTTPCSDTATKSDLMDEYPGHENCASVMASFGTNACGSMFMKQKCCTTCAPTTKAPAIAGPAH